MTIKARVQDQEQGRVRATLSVYLKCLKCLGGCLSCMAMLLLAEPAFAFCDDASPCDADDNQSACQCTDRGCNRNNCLQKSDCCEAFGNIGDR